MSPEARNRHRHGAKGPGRDVGQGDRYNSTAPRPGKNDRSGRVRHAHRPVTMLAAELPHGAEPRAPLPHV